MTQKHLLLALLVAIACSHPAPEGTVTGAAAPATSFTTTKGATVALADTWGAHSQTIVVFYRGFF
ncbi:MAG: hypothetical protein H6Q90_1220 [Deltaproteobacteria bacterium]|nr:hypothetical protein [Deltaproteobacteria bacterium]